MEIHNNLTNAHMQQQQFNGYNNTPRPRKGAGNPPSHHRSPLLSQSDSNAPNHPSHSSGIRTNISEYDYQRQYQRRRQNKGAERQNLHHKLELYIPYADLSIRRAFVASSDPGVSWLTTLLKFQRVKENSLAHLSGESLHTLGVCQNLEKVRERSAELYTQTEDDEKHYFTNSLSAHEVADSLIDNLYADMSIAMDHVRSYLESQFWMGIRPKLWLRFGKILFHSRQNRSNLASHKPFGPEDLERALHGPKHGHSSVLKTFDSGVSHDYFRKIRALVCGDGLGVLETKEKFIIELNDATQPKRMLICTCKRNLTPNGPSLTLCKVKTKPLRHMVADVACMEQEMDLRIILTTRQEFKGDISALQNIVDKAVYDVTIEGGLLWPIGSTSSGPYTVTGVGHMMQTIFKSQGHKWKLRHANRTALNASVARFSYEIDVTALEWASQFQMWKYLYKNESTKDNYQYVDCFFKPLSNLFSWVWTNCI